MNCSGALSPRLWHPLKPGSLHLKTVLSELALRPYLVHLIAQHASRKESKVGRRSGWKQCSRRLDIRHHRTPLKAAQALGRLDFCPWWSCCWFSYRCCTFLSLVAFFFVGFMTVSCVSRPYRALSRWSTRPTHLFRVLTFSFDVWHRLSSR